jgi:Fe-S-cluster containining protein
MEISTPSRDTGIIKKIYSLYEKSLADTSFVCKEGCADCCTCNVTLTSLEALFIVRSLTAKSRADLKLKLEQKFSKKRYVPKMTTNQFAALCVSGGAIPQEENNPDWGKCPLLEKNRCTIYKMRPFGCRSLNSQVNCSKTGFAQVPPLALTITNIFLQYIEHIDHRGFLANLYDMLSFYLEKPETLEKPVGSIPNMKMEVLMVPHQHRGAVGTLLKEMAVLT